MNLNLINLIQDIKNEEINGVISSLCLPSTKIYLVGGYLRDKLLGKESPDRDYVVRGESAAGFARKFADKTDGYFVLLDDEFDIARVVMPDKVNYVDFARCFGEDIYDDLNRRDFTINALALPICTDEAKIIDRHDGIGDLNKKIVRAISEQNLIDDPLRCLRAFRFSAQLGFAIDEKTNSYIQKHLPLIQNVANERILAELIKLFEPEHCSENLKKMKENGLLFYIFPELEVQESVPPNLHHHLNLIDHSIETVRQVEQILYTLPEWVQEQLFSEQANGIKRISLLKIAALLHDLGKPQTWQIDEEGRHRFIKHDDVGAKLAEEPLKRLKFSKNAAKYIIKLIRHHIYPSQLIRDRELTTEKAVMKMFRKLEDESVDVIVLAMADRLSARGQEITDEVINANISGLRGFLEEYKKTKEKVDSIPKLLSGHDIMEILGLPAGPRIGRVLKALREGQLAGDVNTHEEAVAFIKGLEFKENRD